jgi:hypothetical protein
MADAWRGDAFFLSFYDGDVVSTAPQGSLEL